MKERKREDKLRSHANKFTTQDKYHNLISLKCTEATVQKEEADKTGVCVIFCAPKHMIEIIGEWAVQPRLSKKSFSIQLHI